MKDLYTELFYQVYYTEAVKLQIRLFIKENNQPEGGKSQGGKKASDFDLDDYETT